MKALVWDRASRSRAYSQPFQSVAGVRGTPVLAIVL
jgi:hypothetical protein